MRRNIAIAMANSGSEGVVAVLGAWAESADKALSAAARWALGKLKFELTPGTKATNDNQ